MTLVECIYNQVRASYFQCPIKCFLEVSTYLLLYDQIIMFANITCYQHQQHQQHQHQQHQQQQLKIQHHTIFTFSQVLMYKTYLGLLLRSKFTKPLLGGFAGHLTKNWMCKTVSYTEFVLVKMKHPNKSKWVTSAIK